MYETLVQTRTFKDARKGLWSRAWHSLYRSKPVCPLVINEPTGMQGRAHKT